MPGILIAHKVESFEGDRPSKYEQTQICSDVPNVTLFYFSYFSEDCTQKRRLITFKTKLQLNQ